MSLKRLERCGDRVCVEHSRPQRSLWHDDGDQPTKTLVTLDLVPLHRGAARVAESTF